MSAKRLEKFGLGAASVTVAVTVLAACASSSSSGKNGAGGGAQQKSTAAVSASGLKTASTPIGTVLVNASGHTVYELVGDSTAKPTCTAGCLSIWPPVEANGTQVVVNGHPAYTYVGDASAGQTKGQKLKDQWGVWLALDASGNPIGGSGTPGSKAPSGQPTSAKSKAPSGGGPAF